METTIKNSRSNWTIIRPPQLIDGEKTGKYRVSVEGFLKNAMKISRADVAHLMLESIGNKNLFHRTAELAY